MLSSDEGEEEDAAGASTRAWGATLLLLGFFTVNQWSRSLIFYLVDFGTSQSEEASRLFMNMDVGFNQAQYGVLASIGFAGLFSVTSLLAGAAVDRFEPRLILSSSGILWSLALMGQSLATSFDQVLASRMVSGFGQAFCNPAAYTLLGSVWPEEKRASAIGFYSSGLYLGGGLAALSVVLDQALGWRQLSLDVGVLGVALSLTCALLPLRSPAASDGLPTRDDKELSPRTLPAVAAPAPAAGDAAEAAEVEVEALLVRQTGSTVSPADEADDSALGRSGGSGSRGGEVTQEPMPMSALMALRMISADETARWLLLASGLRFMAGFTLGVWIVPYYRAAFPTHIGAEFAFLKAAVNGIAGALSSAGGGLLTDRLVTSDPRVRMWVPAAGSVLATPFWIGTLLAPSLELSLAFLFAEYLFAECWFGPTIAALQASAPKGAEGLTQGLFSTLTLVGNLAPLALGLALSSTDLQLTTLLLYTIPLLYCGSAVAFVLAGESSLKRLGELEQAST